MATIYERMDAAELTISTMQGQITTLQGQISSLTPAAPTGPVVLTEGADIRALEIGDYYIPDATVCGTLLNKPTESNATAFVKVAPGGSAGQKTVYYMPCDKEDPGYYHCAHYQNAWGNWNYINHTDSGWLDLPLADGITAYSEAQKPRYRRVGKEVFLAGVFKGVTAADTLVATLPAGFRPSKKVLIPVASVGQMLSRISIDTNGAITYNRSTTEPVIAENYHSLACSFCAD